ncbi:Hypothetical predicted protein, partial [Pelobates cultripes]
MAEQQAAHYRGPGRWNGHAERMGPLEHAGKWTSDNDRKNLPDVDPPRMENGGRIPT